MKAETSIPVAVQLTLPGWVAGFHADLQPCMDAAAQMAVAVALAQRNVDAASGGPFGAAVFDQHGQAIALGVNRVDRLHCSAAHAEIMALSFAQARLQRARINGDGGHYTLASSAQPCAMCYGASLWAGIDQLLIGARSEDVMRLTQFDEGPLPSDWVGEMQYRGIRVQRDLMREAACAVLQRYADRPDAVHY